jgi:hypothetical protein
MARRTREEWQQLIEAQQSSGLIAAEFCRQQAINATYFSSRKKQLQQSQSGFIQIKASEPIGDVSREKEPSSMKIRRIDVEVSLGDSGDTTRLSEVLNQLLI